MYVRKKKIEKGGDGEGGGGRRDVGVCVCVTHHFKHLRLSQPPCVKHCIHRFLLCPQTPCVFGDVQHEALLVFEHESCDAQGLCGCVWVWVCVI